VPRPNAGGSMYATVSMPLERHFGEGTGICSSRVSVTAVPFVLS
jgi:hypothetical protein